MTKTNPVCKKLVIKLVMPAFNDKHVEVRYKPIWARDTQRKKDKFWEGVRKDFMEKEGLRAKEDLSWKRTGERPSSMGDSREQSLI